jgi:putative DNA methylase
MITTKKLIEVALPLDAINKAAAREKSIRHGHPSTLHLWWARRPLAAARAVIFAQMVDDPSSHPDIFPTAKKQEKERKRLFKIIEDLVQWENTTNEAVLQRARDEIWASWRATCAANADHPRAKELFNRHKLPGFHDPFAGGGALPLEAQRLGLEAYASDLNPVAVLINKAMIEIPPKFAGRPPVNPDWQAKSSHEKAANPWKGAQGLAEDVQYYGKWMRDEAEKRIGHLYPKVTITDEMARERPDLRPMVGQKLTVIAWLWARTVKSPNPAFADVEVPLVSTFMLGTKPGKEAHVEPIVERGGYRFVAKRGNPKDVQAAKSGTKLSRGANFGCLMSGSPITADYIKAEGISGRMGNRLMAVVAEGERGRIYLSPTAEDEKVAASAKPEWSPDQEISYDPNSGATYCVLYGLKRFGDLFTRRQLATLATFAQLVHELRDRVRHDAVGSGVANDGKALAANGTGADAYADGVAVYLALFLSRMVNLNNNLCQWRNDPAKEHVGHLFTRQAIPMIWDFAEANPLGNSAGSFEKTFGFLPKVLSYFPVGSPGSAAQADAAQQSNWNAPVISTDPPYYDNVPYADLSDFFYVWLRRSLNHVFSDLFATLAVPKLEELVAQPLRHGGKEQAERFFVDGMTRVMHRLSEQAHPAFPVTIYYAFKQAETEKAGTASTGWETFLEAVIRAGFGLTGTWPIRTELTNRMVGSGTNALASSIVLVCRPRSANAETVTRREFLAALKTDLPSALTHLQASNIAPVDLAQAAIGPGMAVYTRYARVLDADGKPVSVRDALALINQTLDEVLAEQEGDFDADTRWALAWFEQHGFDAGEYGVAETLSKAKNTSVGGLVDAGILSSKGGKVRLLKPSELPEEWDPGADKRLTVWEMVHHLIRVLEGQGEDAASKLVAKLGTTAEVARELAYRLYALCDRKKRAPLAGSYNGLVQSWPELSRLAREPAPPTPPQTDLFAPK